MITELHYITLDQITDYHKKKQLDPTNLSERDRVNVPAKAQEYSFRNYLAYALYSPLYLAGPILTFNDYISQQRHTPPSITRKRTMMYGIRFLLSFLVMEVMIHYIYVIAISKAQPAWEVYTPFQLSMLGYFSLHHIWLKLLLPWRFFRLWSLLDGIDPPENVVRCMSDNYSTFAFWRGWHRSFGRWTIRYIYIPLGGSGGPGTRGKYGQVRGLVNLLVVFTFVAIWHDIQLRLLVWGWLISLFVLPETIATILFPQRKWQNHKEAYRILCGIGAVGNILMMMSANLVGFAVGLDGLKGLVQGIIGSNTGMHCFSSNYSIANVESPSRSPILRMRLRRSLQWRAGHVRAERARTAAGNQHQMLAVFCNLQSIQQNPLNRKRRIVLSLRSSMKNYSRCQATGPLVLNLYSA